jgi:transforming growth factor-beta-induced protein
LIPDLLKTLNDDKEITVFAPTNEAFENLDDAVATNLLTGENTPMWKEHLEDLLNYHVLPIVVPSSEITDGLESSITLNDEEIGFTLDDPTSPDDTGIFVNTDAEVIEADIDIVNGIVHVIDDVLLPAWVGKSIIDIATDDENPPTELPVDEEDINLERLGEELLKNFDLNETLSEPGGYTVFAPTTAAFIEDDELKLKDLSVDQLSSVLNYHVVEGVYPESVLIDGFTLETLQGETIIFGKSTAPDMDGNDIVTTKVNDKFIITPNILANNGIVHVIDGVLIPEG